MTQGLGESVDGPFPWDNGAPPPLVPVPRLLGNPACFVNGDLFTDLVNPDNAIDGIPNQCYIPISPRPQWGFVADVTSCSVQFLYVRVIEWLYADRGDLIGPLFVAWLGPEYVVTVRPAAGDLPSIATIIGPDLSLAIMDGTRRFQTLALQGFYGLTGPQNFGIYGTDPIWYAASTYIHLCLVADGANLANPVMLVGHSYGAAAALLLAARYRHAQAGRAIHCFTIGAPKPGDARLNDTLQTCAVFNLANDNDFITILPPNLFNLAPVVALLGNLGFDPFLLWDDVRQQTSMLEDGTLRPNVAPIMSTVTLAGFCVDAIAHLQIPTQTPHLTTEYARRILARCPLPEYPVSPVVWALLFETMIGLEIGLELPAAAGLEIGSRSFSVVGLGIELGANSPGMAWGSIELSREWAIPADPGRGIELSAISPGIVGGLGIELGIVELPAAAQGIELGIELPAAALGVELLSLLAADGLGVELGIAELPAAAQGVELGIELPAAALGVELLSLLPADGLGVELGIAELPAAAQGVELGIELPAAAGLELGLTI